jgi:hypothetical protein
LSWSACAATEFRMTRGAVGSRIGFCLIASMALSLPGHTNRWRGLRFFRKDARVSISRHM